MPELSGVISEHELYTLPELQRRLGIASWTWKKLQLAGMRSFKLGRRKYVRGKDVLQFLEEQDSKAG